MFNCIFAILIVSIMTTLAGAETDTDSTPSTPREASYLILFNINKIKKWGCRVKQSETIAGFIAALKADVQPLIKDNAVLALHHKEKTLILSQNNPNNLLEALCTLGHYASIDEMLADISTHSHSIDIKVSYPNVSL